ncbi:serine/threonine-protein kinase ULK1-like isoform X2 [Branchiostoma floridae]|uniref:Serine/threonine-protein kinase ULK1-like isoform X2 n=1 Tax=Branchiostoma floridae TaxID=7739 RepID=A0A9J7KVA7_BRAFL|nr:serine/threonine-protein kinase ULK1-like isoform X2 [Branchiostoma floridae]
MDSEMEREPPDGAGDSLLQPTNMDKNKEMSGDIATTSCTSLQKDTTGQICSVEEYPVSAMDQSDKTMTLATAKDTRTLQNTETKEGSRDIVKYPVLVLDTTENSAALATAKDFVKDDLAMYGPQMEEGEDTEPVEGEEDHMSESLNAIANLDDDLDVSEQSESYEEQEVADLDSTEVEADQDDEKGLQKVKDVDDDTAVFGAEGPSGKLGKDYAEDEEVVDQEDDDLMLLKEAEDKVRELQQHHRNHALVVSNLQDVSTTLQRIAARQMRGEHHSGLDPENLVMQLMDRAHKNAAQSCSQYSEVIRLYMDRLRRAKENATQLSEHAEGELDDRSVVYVEDREEEASGIERPTSLHVSNVRDVHDDSLSSERTPNRQIHTVSPSQVRHYCKMWEQLREDGRVPEGRDGFYLDNIAWTWDDIGRVGQGTFGTVHLGQPQPYFAVKKVDLSKFEADEVEILAQLDHSAVVKLLAVVRDSNTMHICTEYLGDEVVERVINDNNGLAEPTALFITIQLLEGLVYLHNLGIVHRDVKAANAMLCRVSETVPDRVQVKLIDFGSAKRIPRGHKWVQDEEREPKGTPTHMSPEMARADEHNCTTDIWSLGCTTLHMLTGRHPWQKYAVRSFQLIYQIGAYPERILDDIPHTTHGSLRDLLHQCFTQCRKERPQAQDILDLAWDAHKLVSDQPAQDNVPFSSLQPSSLKASVASCLGAPPSSSSVPLPPPGVPPPPARALTPALPPDSAQSTKASTEVSDPRDLDKMRRLLQELEMEDETVAPTTPVGSCQVEEDVVMSSQSGTDQARPLVKMPSFVPTNELSQSVDMYGTWGQGEVGTDSLGLGPDMPMANWDLPANANPLLAAQDTDPMPSDRVTTDPPDEVERLTHLIKTESQETPTKHPCKSVPKTLRLDMVSAQSAKPASAAMSQVLDTGDSEQSTPAKSTSTAMPQMLDTSARDRVQSTTAKPISTAMTQMLNTDPSGSVQSTPAKPTSPEMTQVLDTDPSDIVHSTPAKHRPTAMTQILDTCASNSLQSTPAKSASTAMLQMSDADPSDIVHSTPTKSAPTAVTQMLDTGASNTVQSSFVKDNTDATASDRQELQDTRPRSASRGISRLACTFTNLNVPKQ